MPFADVNLLAMLASLVAVMILGMIWYSQTVFGKIWILESGANMAEQTMGRSMTIGILGNLIMTYVIGLLLEMAQPGSFKTALLFTFVLWLGFIVTTELSRTAWERRSFTLLLINAGWSLLAVIATTAIYTYWPV